jgi:hypothetical protein
MIQYEWINLGNLEQEKGLENQTCYRNIERDIN